MALHKPFVADFNVPIAVNISIGGTLTPFAAPSGLLARQVSIATETKK